RSIRRRCRAPRTSTTSARNRTPSCRSTSRAGTSRCCRSRATRRRASSARPRRPSISPPDVRSSPRASATSSARTDNRGWRESPTRPRTSSRRSKRRWKKTRTTGWSPPTHSSRIHRGTAPGPACASSSTARSSARRGRCSFAPQTQNRRTLCVEPRTKNPRTQEPRTPNPEPRTRSQGAPVFDYLVVGAGCAGSVVAERLAAALDKKVLIVDKRPHIGGNAYDHYDEHGILVHKYGPHIFHTNSREVFTYLSRFTDWHPYQHRVQAWVDGRLVPIPINLDTINALYGTSFTSLQLADFFKSMAEPRSAIRTSEDVIVSQVGRELYEKFFRNYTRKQWGLDPSELDAAVTARVPVRTNRDDRYFTDAYQAMPRHGYTRMFERMLAHRNIKIMLNTDYREIASLIPHREVIYTGPIDEFFDNRFGKLPYRSLDFKFETLNKEWHQPV